MFVPRAVKRTGPVSKIHNKKPKKIIIGSEISKESTAENWDLVVQDKQQNIAPAESINLGENDKTTSVDKIKEITQITDQQISLKLNNFEHNIIENNKVEHQELDKYSQRIIVNEQVSNSQDQENVAVNVEQEETVKEYSNQQRTAVAGEPICVICGKYGEYICDETDHDVCSFECKKIDIERVKNGGNIQRFSLKETRTKIEVQTPISGLFHVQLTGYTLPTDSISLTEVQIQNILKRNKINVQGKNISRPILSFSQCKLPSRMMENLQTEGYTQPTSIQMQIIPTALMGRDILASGQTGSGKTASFLIPIISHCWSLSQCYEGKNGPYAIILAPTRELCSQIENLAKGLIKGLTNMKTSLLVGGLPIPNQVHRLKQGTQIAIATPGRLIDILNQTNEEFSMNNIHMFVLDEVDMMFKMGFEKQVREIIDKLPLPITSARRQTLMISATFPKIIAKLANSLLKDHIRIVVGAQQDDSKDPGSSRLNFIPCIPVKQTILWIENKSKKKQLFSLLNDSKYYNPPIVIFVESKMGADLLSQAIEKKCNVRSVSIHGDKLQEERTMILQSFLSGDYDVIVSTGVLSRGLNLPDVKMVINFDMAVSVDEYVHQVGRASGNGNSGNSSGWAITFINEDHKHLFKEFVHVLNAQPTGKVTPLPSKLLVHGCTLYGNNRSSSSKK